MRVGTVALLILLSARPLLGFAPGGWKCSPDSTVPLVVEPGSQWNVRMTGDEAHGVIAVWQDRRGAVTDRLYAQRINAAGETLWDSGGVRLSETPGYQYYPQILSDGTGGAYVVWQDNRSGTEYDIYLQYISATGDLLFTNSGLPICNAPGNQYNPQIVRGLDAEIIVVWQDRRDGNYDIYAQRLGSLGGQLWQLNGVPVTQANSDQIDPRAVPDGSGGVLVAWSDFRGGSGFSDIYAQRLRRDGTPAWLADGRGVSQAANSQSNPQVASDNAGGFYVGWQDRRNSFYDVVCLQRVAGDGALMFEGDGVVAAPVEANQFYPQLSCDGTGSAVVVWQDSREGSSGYDIYAQRIGPTGQILWGAGGVPVSKAADHQYYPQVSASEGGVMMVWQDRRGGNFDIYAQRYDLAGTRLWAENGVVVNRSAHDQFYPALCTDGLEGGVIAWSDFRNNTGTTDIYAHRIGSNGLLAGGCFRTFSQDSLSLRGVKIRKREVAMPNAGNVRDSLFQRGAYTHGVVLGLERPDSANRYGWIYYRKSFYVRRHLPQLGENRGFDRRQDKPFRGALKNPSIYRYNNTLAGELLALKMNIAASDVGITPATFGDLKFMDPANPGDVLNGLNLRQITARVDSVMTLWEWFPGVNYDALSASLRKINRSFAGPMDTVSLRPMKLEPVAALFTKNFLVPNTAPPAELPPYVPLDSFEETPASFALMQNFPNPFNPYTTIEFEIPAVSSVDLKVYDLTGREVAALLEEALLDDGTHAVEFDASQLSTGVYFYRLGVRPVGEGEKPLSTVRKMMLIK